MKNLISEYLNFLIIEKNLAHNTIHSYRRDFEDFLSFVNSKNLDNVNDLTHDTIKEYLLNINKREMQASTVNRKIASLSGFFKFLAKEKITEVNLFERPLRPKMSQKLPKVIKFDILNDVYEKFYSVQSSKLDLRNCVIFALFFKTGIRVSELIKIKIMDINNNDDYILISGKGDKERVVPMSDNLKNLINNYVDRENLTPVDYLFKSRNKTKHLTREMVGKIVKKITSQFSLQSGVSPHKLRHAFAKHLLDKGLDIREIQELLGHADISTTSIYTKIDGKEKESLLLSFHPSLIKKRE